MRAADVETGSLTMTDWQGGVAPNRCGSSCSGASGGRAQVNHSAQPGHAMGSVAVPCSGTAENTYPSPWPVPGLPTATAEPLAGYCGSASNCAWVRAIVFCGPRHHSSC